MQTGKQLFAIEGTLCRTQPRKTGGAFEAFEARSTSSSFKASAVNGMDNLQTRRP